MSFPDLKINAVEDSEIEKLIKIKPTKKCCANCGHGTTNIIEWWTHPCWFDRKFFHAEKERISVSYETRCRYFPRVEYKDPHSWCSQFEIKKRED